MIRISGLILALGALAAHASDLAALTEEEFKLARHYQIALEDPRVQKMPVDRRLPAIAKDAGVKVKDLQRAVEKLEAAGDVKAACESAISAGTGAAPLDKRIGKVNVDVAEAHAIAYVEWVSESPALLEDEAAYVAARAALACPIASSIQVWANDKTSQHRIFQALISRTAALRINQDRVKDFARTRYIKLFEQVKNAAAGDAL
jgi:hypothetical protein